MRVRSSVAHRIVLTVLIAMAVCAASGAASGTVLAAEEEGGATAVAQQASVVRWDLAIAVSLSIGLPCLAAGYAIGKVGAAALGAASERPELLTRSLIFVALGEGIAVFGLLVSVLVLVLKF